MSYVKLNDQVTCISIQDVNLKKFDILYPIEHGTSYNSYLVFGSEKIALVDTCKAEFFDEYFKTLKELVDIAKIDYIVMDHNEPDHSGCVDRLVSLNPNITVLSSASGLNFLNAICHVSFKSQLIKDGDSLDLGDLTLEFISDPNLHWPDTTMTYIKKYKLLLTCDFYGAHYCNPDILYSKVQDKKLYDSYFKQYYDAILKPFDKPFLINGIKKVENIDIDMVGPSHGCVIDSDVAHFTNLYESYSLEDTNKTKKVTILYASAYGYTKNLAEHVMKGLKDSGIEDIIIYDVIHEKYQDYIDAILESDGFLIGSPTMLSDAIPNVWHVLAGLNPIESHGKFAASFGSYGWSGEACNNINQRFAQLRLKTLESVKCKFKPTEQDLISAHDLGYDMGCYVLGIKTFK